MSSKTVFFALISLTNALSFVASKAVAKFNFILDQSGLALDRAHLRFPNKGPLFSVSQDENGGGWKLTPNNSHGHLYKPARIHVTKKIDDLKTYGLFGIRVEKQWNYPNGIIKRLLRGHQNQATVQFFQILVPCLENQLIITFEQSDDELYSARFLNAKCAPKGGKIDE